jgi:hypothetical protein
VVKPRIPPDSATKRRLAITQMRRVILLLEEGDFICALTLAGAAEEILGRMIARKGRSTAMEDFAVRDRKLWECACFISFMTYHDLKRSRTRFEGGRGLERYRTTPRGVWCRRTPGGTDDLRFKLTE